MRFMLTFINCILFYIAVCSIVASGAFTAYYIYDGKIESVKNGMIVLWSIFGTAVLLITIIYFINRQKKNDAHIAEFEYDPRESLMTVDTGDMISV